MGDAPPSTMQGSPTAGGATGWPVALAIGAVGASAVCTQLALMREMMAAFGGNELILGLMLGNWLLLTGLGARLGRGASRLARPAGWLAGGLILLAGLPIVQVVGLRLLRDTVLVRGAEGGPLAALLGSGMLLLPYCLVSGLMLTVGCAMLGRDGGRTGIGRVYLADSLGSIVGGLAFTFVLVQRFDHIALLYVPALANLAMAGLVAWRCPAGQSSRRPLTAMLVVACVAAGGLVAIMLASDLDGVTVRRQYPGRRIVFHGNSPYARLVVARDDGQINFIQNGVPVLSSDDVVHAETMVHYALLQRPNARRVLLIGGGLSGTVPQALKHHVEQVVYVELDPLIIRAGQMFLPGELTDPRVRVVNADGRQFVRQTGSWEKFDVVILDLPPPTTSGLNRFYTRQFYAGLRSAMSEDAVVCLPMGVNREQYDATAGRVLACQFRTAAACFRNVMMVPGENVVCLASDGPLDADIIRLLETRRLPDISYVDRDHLGDWLRPDRFSRLKRVAEADAGINEDFNPRLYFYQAMHWASQFESDYRLAGLLLAGGLLYYLARLGAMPLAVFASGFAASGLEMVLLLGLQILCGSVYNQLGLVVTVFMAGLAAGAWWGNRPRRAATVRKLIVVQTGITFYAVLLPAGLMVLAWVRPTVGWGVTAQAVIAALTFVLAAMVGVQFPLASRLAGPGRGGAAPSRRRRRQAVPGRLRRGLPRGPAGRHAAGPADRSERGVPDHRGPERRRHGGAGGAARLVMARRPPGTDWRQCRMTNEWPGAMAASFCSHVFAGRGRHARDKTAVAGLAPGTRHCLPPSRC